MIVPTKKAQIKREISILKKDIAYYRRVIDLTTKTLAMHEDTLELINKIEKLEGGTKQ